MKHHAKTYLVAALALVAFVGCATVADVLESQPTAAVISLASQAGAATLTNATGMSPTSAQTAILNTAASAAIKTTTTDAVWWFAEWLRSKQSTTSAAKTGVLATQVPVPIASSVTKLAATGIPADIANEAIAMTISAVAAQRSPTGK